MLKEIHLPQNSPLLEELKFLTIVDSVLLL